MSGDGGEKPRPGRVPDVGPLRFVVEGEARRVLSDAQIQADPARLAAGWQRRFIADGARCEEMMRLYEELGYEVVADSIQPEHVGADCEDCRIVILLQFKMIYTRRKPAQGA